MWKSILAFLVLALVPLSSRAENWADKMFKDSRTHKFGNVPNGTQLYHRFEVTNIYAVPLRIMEVRTSCGLCSSATASSSEIAPKMTGHVDVNMNALKFTGQKDITIFVKIGDGKDYYSEAVLTLSAFSRQDVVFNPGSVNFGKVPTGKKSTKTIDVEYAGPLDWKVEEIDTDKGPFEATLKELYREKGKVGYQVVVTLKDDAPAGVLKKEIFLKTNDPLSKVVPVVVSADLESALTVRPERVTLPGDVKVGDEITRKIVIRGTKPFRVDEVEGLGESEGIALKEKLPTSIAAVHTLNIQCKPTTAGEFKKVLRIKTDLQDKPVIVKIEGTVDPAETVAPTDKEKPKDKVDPGDTDKKDSDKKDSDKKDSDKKDKPADDPEPSPPPPDKDQV